MDPTAFLFGEENFNEIYASLRQKEENFPPFRRKSPQLQYRPSILNGLVHICDRLNFSDSVLHLSVYLIDHWMDRYRIEPSCLKLLLLSSVKIATKVSDMDDEVPSFTELNEFVGKAVLIEELVSMEYLILKFFKWRVIVPTISTFVSCFRLYLFTTKEVQPNLKILQRYPSIQQFKDSLLKEVEANANCALKDVKMHQFAPSMIAAACVAIARQSHQVTPIWSTHLHLTTKYSYCSLRPAIQYLRA